MYTKLYRALILTFCISCDLVTSSTKLTHITQKSHPMLASLFNVANNIRRFDGQVGEQINDRGTVSNGGGKISMASVNHGVKKQPDIVNFAKPDIPSKKIPKSFHRDIHAEKIAGLDNTMIRSQDVFQVADIQSGSRGKPTFSLQKEAIILDSSGAANLQDIGKLHLLTDQSFAAMSADMLCNLCRRERNETCIAMHCWNNEIERQISELVPLRPETANTPFVGLSENFDFRNQIHRHALLQLTTNNAAPDQNINRGHLGLQSRQPHVQIPGNTDRKNIAPIWSMSDQTGQPRVQIPRSTDRENIAPIWSMSDQSGQPRVQIPVSTDRKNMAPIWSMSDQSGQPRVQIPDNTDRKNMAPIWSMSDSLQDKTSTSLTPLTSQPLWSLTDRINMVPNVQPQKTVTVGNGGSVVNVNDFHAVNKRPVAVQQPRHGMSFVQGNTDTAVLNEKQRPGLRDMAPPLSEPIGISTDILRQLIRLEAASDHTSNHNVQRNFPNTHTDRGMVFSPSGNANNINSEVSNGIPPTAGANGIDLSANHGNHEIRFPDGFVEGPSNVHRNDINPADSVPQIPLASDVFSSSPNVDRTDTRHTLVIKDHGNTEVLGVHVGNGPILRSGVRPLEMSGQNVVRQPQNNQPEHTHAAEGHSHQVSQDHHSPIISNQHNHHEHSTETNANGHEHGMDNTAHHGMDNTAHLGTDNTAHHGMDNTAHHGMDNTAHHGMDNTAHHGMDNTAHHGMDNTDHHGMASLTGTTTTALPTMDPVRRASLQNWSRELLQGLRL